MNTSRAALVDSLHRPVNYLRFSVTDRCNLRCRYCAPSMPKRLASENLLSTGEIHRLVGIGVGLGITKIRLTGGEPLIRPGITGLVERLHQLSDIRDISLTTNGTMIAAKSIRLKQAGLRRINISLDTLDREKFRRLTGLDLFSEVWKGIMTSAEVGFDPVKINTVVMKDFNGDEIEAMAGLALKYPFHVRFIEYMPIGTDPASARRHFLSVEEIERRLSRMGRLIPVAHEKNDGPAVRYRFEGAPGEIGLIGSMSRHFCGSCNRMRLTAGGHLRPCLLSEDQVDIMTPLRSGATDEEIAALFVQALAKKRGEHGLGFTRNQVLPTKMVSIGG